MLDWMPVGVSRRVGRPSTRWEDSISDFVRHQGQNRRVLAEDWDKWDKLEEDFVNLGESAGGWSKT